MSSDVVAEGAKYEELEKIIINNDEKNFFPSGSSVASLGEGRTGCFPQEER